MGQPRIEIFTVKARPFVAIDQATVILCDLDALTNVSNTLQSRAEALVQHPELLAQYERPLKKAFQCQYKATRYALQYLPAIVFDKQFVIYGGTIQEAMTLYQSIGSNGTANRLKPVAISQRDHSNA